MTFNVGNIQKKIARQPNNTNMPTKPNHLSNIQKKIARLVAPAESRTKIVSRNIQKKIASYARVLVKRHRSYTPSSNIQKKIAR